MDATLSRAETRPRWAEPTLYLAVGIPLAFVFTWTPILGFIGWFLASLVHEVGHSAFGWITGHPSVPAIALTGNAVAVHSAPMLIVRLAVVVGVVAAAYHGLQGRARVVAIASFLPIYALLALTPLCEIGFLASGHLGELVAGSVCLWRAAGGAECHSRAERAAYSMLGWFLIGDNILLSFGLAFSAAARAEYATNGSFGLTNDYLRLANDHLGVPLEAVGLVMGLLALAVPAATIGAFAWRDGRR